MRLVIDTAHFPDDEMREDLERQVLDQAAELLRCAVELFKSEPEARDTAIADRASLCASELEAVRLEWWPE